MKTAVGLEEDKEFGTSDFMVTRDFSLLKETLRPVDGNTRFNPDLSPEGPAGIIATESNLHEFSL